jgi:putative FmdB family regulatory protein
VPTYEYRCADCDRTFDIVQSFHDEPLTECPTCGNPVRKVFGNVGIVFKGSGFYKNDSRSGGSSKAKDSAASSGGDSSSGDSSTPSTDSSESKSSSSESKNGSSETTKPAGGDSPKSPAKPAPSTTGSSSSTS